MACNQEEPTRLYTLREVNYLLGSDSKSNHLMYRFIKQGMLDVVKPYGTATMRVTAPALRKAIYIQHMVHMVKGIREHDIKQRPKNRKIIWDKIREARHKVSMIRQAMKQMSKANAALRIEVKRLNELLEQKGAK